MFYSFVLKLKLIGVKKIKIEKNKNFKDFSKEFFIDKGVTVSNFLTKDKEFLEGKVYLVKITSLNSEITGDILKKIFTKTLLKEPLVLQENSFLINEIIHNNEKNSYAKHFLEKDLLELRNLEEITIQYLTPTLFKIGDNFSSVPSAYIQYKGLLKKFNTYFISEEMENALKGYSDKLFKEVTIKKSDIRVSSVEIDGKKYQGFLGEITYSVPRDENLGKVIDCLSEFAFFSGVGHFTQQGLGQIKIVNKK